MHECDQLLVYSVFLVQGLDKVMEVTVFSVAHVAHRRFVLPVCGIVALLFSAVTVCEHVWLWLLVVWRYDMQPSNML